MINKAELTSCGQVTISYITRIDIGHIRHTYLNMNKNLLIPIILIVQLWGGIVSHAQDSQDDLSSLGASESLRSLLAASLQQQDFLEVDEAFKLTFQVASENSVNAIFQVAEGYYLYKEKIEFTTETGERPVSIQLPAATIKQDPYFGEVEIFDTDFSALIDFQTNVESMIIHAVYQGCATDGICYSPVNQTFDLADLRIPASDAQNPANPNRNASESTSGQQSMLTLLLGAFVAGILLTFTPCVLPMVPILSSIIAGQGQSITRTRGGLLALAYVLGTAVTYAAMGALAGATGDQLQAYFQNIWAIGLLSALFVVMAMSLFGLFEFQMPSAIQQRIQRQTDNWARTAPLVFVLGLFSALIIGACVSPVLISVLGVAVTSGSASLGAKLMFAMAIGMGLPLIALGIGAGHLIPRAGPWMEKIKQGFAVMLLALAIYFLGTLPEIPVLLLWGSFFIILSVFLGATRHTESLTSNWQRFEKGLGIILLVWGIILIIGGLLGQRDVFRPLPQSLFTDTATDTSGPDHINSSPFIQISDLAQLEQQLATATANNKKVLIDYYADWCVDCVKMEKATFSDPQVIAKLNADFVALQIDVTDPKDEAKKQLKQRFDVFGPPATLFFDQRGQLLPEKGFYGYMDSTALLALLSES